MHLPLSALCFALFSNVWDACTTQTQLRVPADQEVTTRKRIAIVGGGTGGLAALKTFVHDIPKAPNEKWEVILFEQRPNVGGVWLEDPKEPHESQLPETPLYPRLHTNTPNPTMTYIGFPFPPLTPLYPSHQYIQEYHADYADHYGLNPHIKLNHSVSSALWVGDSTKGYWDVTVQIGYPVEVVPGSSTQLSQPPAETEFTAQFDHLVVANGHNHYPEIPAWARNTEWSDSHNGRTIIHSIYYRNPRDYAGKKVLVVGAGASGADIAAQVAEFAEKTYHSFKDKTDRQNFPRLPNVVYKSRTSHLTRTSVIFDDGSEIHDIDIIVLGTGFQNRFPFLCSNDPYASGSNRTKRTQGKSVLVTDPQANSRPHGPIASNLEYVFPLDRQIISLSTLHPLNALTFIGLPLPIANAPSDIVQSLFAGHLIANRELLFPGTEDVARENLLRDLTAREDKLREQGFDPYRLGQRLVGINNTELDYQEELYSFLKSRGAIPEDGKNFVEEWRIYGRQNAIFLKEAWKEVEARGEQRKWLTGVETEEEWADLLHRLVDWAKSIGL